MHASRHRLYHVRHRFDTRPRNPVNPLIQHFVKSVHWLCRGYESSSLFTRGYIHDRDVVSPCQALYLDETTLFRC